MPFDYTTALKRIASKAEILKERYRRILESRDAALAQADELRQQLEMRDKEIERLQQEVEYLRLASTIAPSKEQIRVTKDMITNLVRDIDRCISDLSD